MPPNTKKVDRSTAFGNPFTVAEAGSAEAAVAQFDAMVNGTEITRTFNPGLYRAHVRSHLAGFNLACWCRPDSPCHVDVLLRVANQELVE